MRYSLGHGALDRGQTPCLSWASQPQFLPQELEIRSGYPGPLNQEEKKGIESERHKVKPGS